MDFAWSLQAIQNEMNSVFLFKSISLGLWLLWNSALQCAIRLNCKESVKTNDEQMKSDLFY